MKTETTTYSYAQIWHIAFPMLLSTLMEQLVGMTDAAFLGRVGEIELGASALGGIFYIAIFMLGLGFCTGAQILMARRNGEGRYTEIGNIFYHSLFFLMALATVLYAASLVLVPRILPLIIHSPAVCSATGEYIVWRVPGFFVSYVAVLFRAIYVATTNTRMLTLNSLTMVGANIVFNYLLIFGKCGLPAMGIAGAALGSVLAGGVSMVFFIVYTRRCTDYRRYALHRLPHFRRGMLGGILNLSVWTMIQDFLSLATWFIFFLAVENLGERQLAATNVVRNISSFTFMTVIALSSTATTLVGNLMGQGRTDEVMLMLRRVVRLGFYILTPVLLLATLFPDPVLRIFTANEALINAARPALYVLFTSYVFTIPAQIYFHAVAGTGNTRTALRIEVVALGIYTAFIVVVIFQLRAPLAVCWVSEHVYAALALVLSLAYMRSGRWRDKQI